MPWDEIPEDAESKQSSDWPVIPDDVYNAVITEVGEPYERETPYGPKKKFAITWTLSGGDLAEPVAGFPQFVTIPPKFIETGFLSDKSTLFKIMAALGFDMEKSIKVQPWTWVGKEARVDVETTSNDDGTQTSWIVKVKPPRQRNTAARPPARQPAAAGARKADGWDDDDNN